MKKKMDFFCNKGGRLYFLGNVIEPFPKNSKNSENYSRKGLWIKFGYLEGQSIVLLYSGPATIFPKPAPSTMKSVD